MARLLNNPLGSISGKAGTLVFKKTKHGNFISSLPVPSNKKPSEPQLLQRNKMKVIMHFLGPLKHILKLLFSPNRPTSASFHFIKSYYLLHGLHFGTQGYEINYATSLMSYGDLRPPEQAFAQWDGAQEVLLEWNPQSEQALAHAEDYLFAVVYHPPTHQFFFAPQLAVRNEGQTSFLLPSPWSSFTSYKLWIGFHQLEAQKASMSVYMGEL